MADFSDENNKIGCHVKTLHHAQVFPKSILVYVDVIRYTFCTKKVNFVTKIVNFTYAWTQGFSTRKKLYQ